MKDRKLAQVLYGGFLAKGIVILAGETKRRTYKNERVLDRFSWFLAKSNLEYSRFNYVLTDFHKKGRRWRRVTVFVRKDFLAKNYVEIIPSEKLRIFQWTLSHRKQAKLIAFFNRQSNVLISVSDGDENQELHALLLEQLDTSGKNLTIIESPVVNVFNTGVSRKSKVQSAYVYMIG